MALWNRSAGLWKSFNLEEGDFLAAAVVVWSAEGQDCTCWKSWQICLTKSLQFLPRSICRLCKALSRASEALCVCATWSFVSSKPSSVELSAKRMFSTVAPVQNYTTTTTHRPTVPLQTSKREPTPDSGVRKTDLFWIKLIFLLTLLADIWSHFNHKLPSFWWISWKKKKTCFILRPK